MTMSPGNAGNFWGPKPHVAGGKREGERAQQPVSPETSNHPTAHVEGGQRRLPSLPGDAGQSSLLLLLFQRDVLRMEGQGHGRMDRTRVLFPRTP